MPLIAIIDSHGLLKPTRKQKQTKRCAYCKNWFAPAGYSKHAKRCATLHERPQRFFERPEHLRLMGDTL
jgi:hypothetical protein